DEVLSKLSIIPFEGATTGRELYREAKLMLAIKEMQNKNYQKGLQFIAEAKIWPENLGVGKPYQNDVDDRLEEWMNYLCYNNINKTKEAQDALQKIILFKPLVENTVSNFLSANHLITAWALQKTGKTTEALNWLDEQIKLYPGNKILLWDKAIFEKTQNVQSNINDAGVTLLKQLMQLQ
ncbi:MAG: DUF5107 domain-containing protein, partial [Chitinophagaceae bacterium]